MSDWLKRWPARFALSAAVAVGVATCVPRSRPSSPPVSRAGREPEIRIGLAIAATHATVGGQAETAAVVEGQPAFRLAPGQYVTLEPEDQAVRVTGGPAPGRYQNLSFVSLAPERFVLVEGKPYRGVADAYVRNGALYVVNRLAMDAYLQGVVSLEMGRRAAGEVAALQAQAVVSRTYAIGNRNRYSAQGFDLGPDVTDQAYGGVGAESEQGNQAVRATRGTILTYRDRPIRAFFHSTCGYATAAPEEAFRQIGSEPYLRSVSDRNTRGGYYCDISPRFRWQVEWDADTLARILRRTAPPQSSAARGQIDRISDVKVARTGASGRVMEVRVSAGTGDVSLTAPDLRFQMRTPAGDALGSSAFQLHSRRDGAGRLYITAAGAGWGHGVGMCQWGAVGRARAGQSWQTIVTTYFPGAELQRWY